VIKKRVRRWNVYAPDGRWLGMVRAVDKEEALELVAHMASTVGGARKRPDWQTSDVIVRRTDRQP